MGSKCRENLKIVDLKHLDTGYSFLRSFPQPQRGGVWSCKQKLLALLGKGSFIVAKTEGAIQNTFLAIASILSDFPME